MRYPKEKTPDPLELPNPELNPLLNPTLGRNLGRWAEVYFTSPPEKREEAVGELLRELKDNPGTITESELAHRVLVNEPPTIPVESRIEDNSSPTLTTPAAGVQCAECGHRHPATQRFCGMCGAPLATDTLEDYGQPFVTTERTAPVFSQTSIFGFDAPPAPANAPPLNNDADIAWLREKNLSGTEGSGGVRKLIAAVVAMAAIGILIYAQSRPESTPSRPTAATTASPRVENAPQTHPSQETAPPTQPASPAASSTPAPPAPAPAPASPTPTANANTVPENAAAAAPTPKQARQENPAASAPAPERAPETKTASALTPKQQLAAANATAGSEDFALATEYLNGKRGPRDSAEAAKFLWKAVGKENPSAILLLSDMYLVGDGVPKSCDQARLLLNAAMRKNVPHAAEKFRNLQTAGCR